MDYNLPDEQVFLRKFGAVEIRLRTLDAAGYARLMGLGPYYPWSGINIHTSIPGQNGQLDTMVDVQRDWFACALAGKRDRTRPTIAVGRDEAAVLDMATTYFGHRPSFIGVVGDVGITWQDRAGRPLLANPAARMLLCGDWDPRSVVTIGPHVATGLGRSSITAGSHHQRKYLLCGPIIARQTPDADPDCLWQRQEAGDIRRTYFTTGLDELQLATYQSFRSDGMQPEPAKRAVQLVTA